MRKTLHELERDQRPRGHEANLVEQARKAVKQNLVARRLKLPFAGIFLSSKCLLPKPSPIFACKLRDFTDY